MMTRIKELRIHLGFSQQKLADRLQVSRSAIAMWETGASRPDTKNLVALSHLFGTSIDQILGNPSGNGNVSIPVLGYIAAGNPSSVQEQVVDWLDIADTLARTGDFFGLVINGDSMEPRICKGDFVIVRKQPDVESGEIAIVLIGDDDGLCKKVIKHKTGLSLVSFNPNYPPRFYTWEEVERLPVAINGRVVELRAKF